LREIGRVPKLAQDRIRRGPVAALLVLFGLFASSGAIAGAGPNIRDTLARPGAARPGAAASTVRSYDPALAADETGQDPTSWIPPVRPRLVLETLFAGRSRPFAAAPFPAPEQDAPSSYRARAPPSA
jgi:hypothetical protein